MSQSVSESVSQSVSESVSQWVSQSQPNIALAVISAPAISCHIYLNTEQSHSFGTHGRSRSALNLFPFSIDPTAVAADIWSCCIHLNTEQDHWRWWVHLLHCQSIPVRHWPGGSRSSVHQSIWGAAMHAVATQNKSGGSGRYHISTVASLFHSFSCSPPPPPPPPPPAAVAADSFSCGTKLVAVAGMHPRLPVHCCLVSERVAQWKRVNIEWNWRSWQIHLQVFQSIPQHWPSGSGHWYLEMPVATALI